METHQLEQIAKMVERLGPIARKERGMRIEAAEWNALVDVLLGVLQVDRAQEEGIPVRLEQRFAPRDHTHLGEVDPAWLDADLQSRLGDGQGSVATRIRLAEMEKKIESLAKTVAQLTTQSETQQKRLDQTRVDELDRSRKLRQFDERFSGVENLRTQVTGISGDMDGVRKNVDDLLELKKSLSDAAGNPIDVAGLRTSLADLEQLRENLKGVDGTLLRLKDIEIKLNEVADAAGVGGQGGLEKRLADAASEMEVRLNARVDDQRASLAESLKADQAAAETRIQSSVTDSLNQKSQALDQTLATRVTESENRLLAEVKRQTDAAAETVRKAAGDDARALIDARLAGLDDQVKSVTGGMIDALKTTLTNQIQNAVTQDLNQRFQTLELQNADRIQSVETAFSAFQAEVPTLVEAGVEKARADIEATVSARIDTSIAAARTSLENSLKTQVQTLVDQRIGDLDARIAASVDSRLANLDQRISQSVAGATQNLPQEVSVEVDRQINELNVTGQVDGAIEKLHQQVRAEQAEALAQQQAKLSNAINSTTTLLRGEISALRTELNTTIDSRIKASATDLQTRFSTDIKSLESRIKPDALDTRVIHSPVRPVIR